MITRAIVRSLSKISSLLEIATGKAAHLRTGSRGEEDAYFHLKGLGYVMVARNYRSPRRRGEIDLIGWEDGMLCFIEVKTRTNIQVASPEAAVDADKKEDLARMAREYLWHLKRVPPYRFDVITVFYPESEPPQFTLFRNAFFIA